MRFQLDCLIVGSKITVFALFYFVNEGNFPSTSIFGWAIDLTEGFLRYRFGGGGGGAYLEGLVLGILRYHFSVIIFSHSVITLVSTLRK